VREIILFRQQWRGRVSKRKNVYLNVTFNIPMFFQIKYTGLRRVNYYISTYIYKTSFMTAQPSIYIVRSIVGSLCAIRLHVIFHVYLIHIYLNKSNSRIILCSSSRGRALGIICTAMCDMLCKCSALSAHFVFIIKLRCCKNDD